MDLQELSDKELLRLAAKAAGLTLSSEWHCTKDGILTGTGAGDLEVWNPLADDGDALRLAIRLFLDISKLQAYDGIEWDNPDRYAATRRAIVLAAAAIGAQL